MRRLALAAIRVYQLHVSPYKGFCRAYRRHAARASCSVLGYRAIRREGVLRGLAILRRRTRLCGVAHRRDRSQRTRLHAQRGVCDLDCCCDVPSCDLGCDAPGGSALSDACDFADCCDCDWRRRKPSRDDNEVHLPPARGWSGR